MANGLALNPTVPPERSRGTSSSEVENHLGLLQTTSTTLGIVPRLRSGGTGILLALVPSLVLGLASPAVASNRDDARAAMIAGVKHFYAGDARAARIELLNATKADPSWGLPHSVAARVFLTLGDGVAANAEIQRAVAGGVEEASLQHLQLHSWLLVGDSHRVAETPLNPNLRPVSRGYALRIIGRAAIERGAMNRAADEFDAALRLTPNSSMLWSDIGRFRMVSGNIAGAVEAAARASALDPRNIEALLLTGELVRGQYGLTASLPWFERVLQVDKNNLPAMLQMAATLGDAGRASDMLAMTRRVLALDPINPQAFYLQAVLAARAGNADLARRMLYRTEGRVDGLPGVMLLRAVLAMQDKNSEQAIAQLEDLIKLQPANLRARQLLGTAMWRAGDGAAAIKTLGPLAERADADSYTLSIIGRAYEAGGNRAVAARYLDRASLSARADPAAFEVSRDLVKIAQLNYDDPDNANIAVPRIASLIASGRADVALGEAQRLRARNPGAPAAHVLVGDALMALGRPRDAAGAYKVASNIRFTEATALRFIAALQKSGQSAAALRVLDLFLAQNPRSVPGLVLASDHFMASGEWDAAIEVLSGLRARLGNRDATILSKLGWAFFGKGEMKDALRFSGAAYQLAPANPVVTSNFGWIMFKTGKDPAGGIALMRKAVGIAPGNAEIRGQLSRALA
jgi:cellulose synthase operon protein C